MSFRLDLHVHSESLGRIFIDVEQMRNSLKQKHLDGVAITNFSNISHAQWFQKNLKEFVIIVGQEVCTKDGHIVGLGLRKKIRNFLSAEETINLIHEQGGIAVAVHPFLHMGVGRKVMNLHVDAVEVYSGILGGYVVYNVLAKKFAQRKKCAPLASSDTTDSRFIGSSYTEILTDNPDGIFDAIRSGKVRLTKRALPIPYAFIIQNIMGFRDVKPCLLHATPCFTCGKSMTFRLFKTEFTCNDCGKKERSRIACCNGHYFCLYCIMKRISEKDDFASHEDSPDILEIQK